MRLSVGLRISALQGVRRRGYGHAATGLVKQASGAPTVTRTGTRMQGREGLHAEAVPGAGGGAAGQGARAEYQRCGAPSGISLQGSTGTCLHVCIPLEVRWLTGRATSNKQHGHALSM